MIVVETIAVEAIVVEMIVVETIAVEAIASSVDPGGGELTPSRQNCLFLEKAIIKRCFRV